MGKGSVKSDKKKKSKFNNGKSIPKPRSEVLSCVFCDMLFSCYWYLERHMMKHTKEKPFFCSKCDMSFTSTRDQKDHEKVHLGILSEKCSFCDQVFVTRKALHQHVRSKHNTFRGKLHSGNKQVEIVKCDGCSKEFTSKKYMRKHYIRIHSTSEERPNKCPLCNMGFYAPFEVRRHISRRHRNDSAALLKVKKEPDEAEVKLELQTDPLNIFASSIQGELKPDLPFEISKSRQKVKLEPCPLELVDEELDNGKLKLELTSVDLDFDAEGVKLESDLL